MQGDKGIIATACSMKTKYYKEYILSHSQISTPQNIQNIENRSKHLTPLMVASTTGNLQLLKLLIKQDKYSVNQQLTDSMSGFTPLMFAIEAGHLGAVTQLMNNGADIHAIDAYGRNCLLVALMSRQIYILEYFLTLPIIHLNFKDNDGNSAIGWACKMNDYQLFSMILLHEKFLASGENEGIPIIKDVPISALLRESSILNINQKNNNGMTPLHLAIIKGSQTMIEELLDNEAEVNSLDNYGESPLSLACIQDRLPIIRLLLLANAKINSKNNKLQTPLLVAAACTNNEELIRVLLDAGADVNQRDNYLNAPIHYAAINHNINAAQILIERGANVYMRNRINQGIMK